jgi:hypothetical protein
MPRYTFTFPYTEERTFRDVMSRLDPSEFKIIEDIKILDLEHPRLSDRQAILEMDPEAALTFRLGTKNVKIRRDRSEEELAEEKRINDQHTIKVTIKVDGLELPPVGTP